MAASQVFTAQVVKMDVTGSGFERMTQFRRSLQHFDYAEEAANRASGEPKVRRKSKKRTSKKRRNTIACDGDRRDIQNALASENNGGPHRLER